MADVQFDNPISSVDADQSDSLMDAAVDAVPPDIEVAAEQAQQFKTNTVGWLKRRCERQNERIETENLHHKFSTVTGSEENLGPVLNSWAFVFRMGREDDVDPGQTGAHMLKSEYLDDDKIPLQAWQLCHRMWKQNFNLHYSFSTTGEYLIITLGLPYKILAEEATVIGISMRMKSTKGNHPFKLEMIERYPDNGQCGCFNSALRQGLCLSRLKRKAKIFPETISMCPSKSAAFKPVRSLFKYKHSIRGRTLYKMFDAFGCYRPNSGKIFGNLVRRVADYVMEDEWVTFEHPEKAKRKATSLLAKAHAIQDAADGQYVRYSDIGKCIHVLENWMKGPGQYERFKGTFAGYFALHHKPTIARFRETWGSYKLIWSSLYVEGKPGEEISAHSMYHPDCVPVKQLSMLYQPIDEIRDYFGDHVALYFAWLGLYTQSLIVPTVFGILGIISQWLAGNSPDKNPTTIPYSVFFAAWSISFLGSWTRKENELKFLWGSEGFEVKERPRPEFVGLHVINPETKRDEVVYRGSFLRFCKLTISFCVSWTFILFTIYCAIWATSLKDDHKLTPNEMIGSCCGKDVDPHDESTCCGCWKAVDGCPVAMHETYTNIDPKYRYAYTQVSNNTWVNTKGCFVQDITTDEGCIAAALTGSGGVWKKSNLYENFKWMALSAVLNLTIIVVYGIIYEKIAELLTNWENHRTLTEWEDSVVIKNFMFQFINNYFVLFYISYLRPFLTNCRDAAQGSGEFCKASDLPELQFQLIIVFTGKTLGWRAGEIIKPWAQNWVAETMKIRKIMQVMKQIETIASSVEHKLHDMEESMFGTSLEKAYGALDDVEQNEAELAERIAQDQQQEQAATLIQAHARGMATRNNIGGPRLGLTDRVQGGQAGEIFESDAAGKPGGPSSQFVNTSGKAKLRRKDLKQQLADHYADDRNVEDEFSMVEFESSFDEFNEMAVQYGYLALFAPAYPLAPLLAFINNVFEIRIDAVKFCTVLQRPRFRQAEDIGAWYTVLNVLGFFAVITNASMIAFVGSQMADDDEVGGPNGWHVDEHNSAAPGEAGIVIRIKSQKLWVVMVLIEHCVMLMRVMILSLSPAVPEWVADARDILQFRTSQWESGVEAMYAAGQTIEDIHMSMAAEENSISNSAHVATKTKLKSLLALPLKVIPGGVPLPKILDSHGQDDQETLSIYEVEAIKAETQAFKSDQSEKKSQKRGAKAKKNGKKGKKTSAPKEDNQSTKKKRTK